MKRTPLARKTKLQRGKKVKPKRATRRRSARLYDPDWLRRVKELPCALAFAPGHVCEGVVEADHVGERGLGQKCSDRETIPLCTRGHRERTDGTGYFRRYTKDDMRAFTSAALRITQQELRLSTVAPGEPVSDRSHATADHDAGELAPARAGEEHDNLADDDALAGESPDGA